MGKFFKWAGIGCGGLLVLVVLLIIIVAAVSSGASDEPEVAVASDTSTQSLPSSPDVPGGKERTSPLPRGYSITHDDFRVTILGVTYSSSEGGIFTSLDENHVWAIVDVRLEAIGDPNRSHSYNTIHFRLVGDMGVIYDEWAFVPDGDIGSGEVFGGATIEGSIIRQVHQDDTNLVLIFSPPFGGSRYLALESEP